MSAKKPPATAPDEVATALELVIGALDDEQARINKEGAQAMQAGDYDTATAVIEFAIRLLAFKGRVDGLQAELNAIEKLWDEATPAVQEIVSKRFFGRRKNGEITGHSEMCLPLLEVLVEMGGKAKTKDALDRLGDKLKGTLKPKDYEAHESKGHQIRWRNTAQWARNMMVNDDGRMTKGSPNGVWEISDKGRAWLKSSRAGK